MQSTGEILVIGGGVISLAIALELKRQGASVTIVSRDFTEAATHAAAGMLAPQAERILPSPMLDLCLRSRDHYADWTQKLEELTGLNPGYWACEFWHLLIKRLQPLFNIQNRFGSIEPLFININRD